MDSYDTLVDLLSKQITFRITPRDMSEESAIDVKVCLYRKGNHTIEAEIMDAYTTGRNFGSEISYLFHFALANDKIYRDYVTVQLHEHMYTLIDDKDLIDDAMEYFRWHL